MEQNQRCSSYLITVIINLSNYWIKILSLENVQKPVVTSSDCLFLMFLILIYSDMQKKKILTLKANVLHFCWINNTEKN